MSRLSDTPHVPLRAVLSFMWHYYRRHKWFVLGAYLAITYAAITGVVTPYLYSWLVDVASSQLHAADKNIWMILKPILAIVLMSISYHIATRTAHFFNCFTDSKVQAAVAADASARVHRFETEWHANNFSGSMVTAIKRGRSSAHTFFDQLCYDFWPAIIVAFGSIILMLQKSLMLGIFFIIYAVLFTSFSMIVSHVYVMPTNRKYSDEDSRLGGVIADSLSGHAVVKAFGAEKRESERLTEAANHWQKLACKAWVRINILTLSQNVIINIGRLVSLLLAATLWASNKFNAGDIMYVLMAQRVMADYLDGIGNNLNKVITAINDMEEVVAWSLRRPKIESRLDAKHAIIKNGAIGFNRINFFYNENSKPALSDFTLNIAPGEKVALVGPSGGGKSTVLKLLQRFYEPQQGVITLDDHNINELDLSSMRAAMALVPQDPVLFHRSLADNIAYACPGATMEQIKQAAQAAQIASLIDGLPQGYETLVGERGIKLSGGERQRVAIARAILANAPVLLLDEATSALDSEAEEEIQKAIAEASKGRTMIAIAHRLSTIQSADRIIVLAQGRIVEQGSHYELLKLQDGLYRRLYEAQAKGFLPDHLV